MPKCNAFTNHMCVKLNGSWTTCCSANDELRNDASKMSFYEYKNSDHYKKIVKDMEDGWSSNCIYCELAEQQNRASTRHGFNQDLSGKDRIEYAEISLSNKCNLACRMCTSIYSSHWSILTKNNKELIKYDDITNPFIMKVEQIFSNIDLTHLKKIKYLGGEPFITPEIIELFKFLDKHGIIENLEFECTTNCTLFPDKHLEYLSRFRKLFISLSIDGYDKVNDYIRHGKKWKDIEPNIIKWIEFKKRTPLLTLNIHTTVQAYNLHDLGNLKNYADDIGIDIHFSLLQFPNYLHIGVLPKEYLEEIKNSHNSIFYKSIQNHRMHYLTFKDYTLLFDKISGINYTEIMPNLKKYMENYQ